MVEFPEFVGSIDHKLCPSCLTLLGCVYEGDVWVLDAKTGKKHQLTKTAGGQCMRLIHCIAEIFCRRKKTVKAAASFMSL